jgi:prevent-host-death family protein
MKTYTYSEARQQLAGLLDEAYRQGEVRIRRRDGRLFALQPVRSTTSPLDVPPVTQGVSLSEILESIREGREAGLPEHRQRPASKRKSKH